jgi:hypothetical protein
MKLFLILLGSGLGFGFVQTGEIAFLYPIGIYILIDYLIKHGNEPI